MQQCMVKIRFKHNISFEQQKDISTVTNNTKNGKKKDYFVQSIIQPSCFNKHFSKLHNLFNRNNCQG